MIYEFQLHFRLFCSILDNTKTPVIAQRRIIVQNPDGTTKVIVQNVLQSSSQVFNRIPFNSVELSERHFIQRNVYSCFIFTVSYSIQKQQQQQQARPQQQPSQRQKLGIIRGPDGKITSVTGLQPGQKLIESPTGLRIVTTAAANRPDRKLIMKSELPKMVSKVSSTQHNDSDNAANTTQPKTPVVVRQQVGGASANVILKSVASKPVASSTPQSRSVVLNSGHQVLGKLSLRTDGEICMKFYANVFISFVFLFGFYSGKE